MSDSDADQGNATKVLLVIDVARTVRDLVPYVIRGWWGNGERTLERSFLPVLGSDHISRFSFRKHLKKGSRKGSQRLDKVSFELTPVIDGNSFTTSSQHSMLYRLPLPPILALGFPLLGTFLGPPLALALALDFSFALAFNSASEFLPFLHS